MAVPANSAEQIEEARRLLDDIDTETTSQEMDVEIAKARALIAIGFRLDGRPPPTDGQPEPVEINTPAVRYHLAGVLHDKLAEHLTLEQFADVAGAVFVVMDKASAGLIPDIDEQDETATAPPGSPP